MYITVTSITEENVTYMKQLLVCVGRRGYWRVCVCVGGGGGCKMFLNFPSSHHHIGILLPTQSSAASLAPSTSYPPGLLPPVSPLPLTNSDKNYPHYKWSLRILVHVCYNTGQVNTLTKLLKNEKTPFFRNLVLLPLLVQQETDPDMQVNPLHCKLIFSP